MERQALAELVKWKDSKYRKPLILKGVRQVGKTWILREFGRRHFGNVAYFNFDENEEYKQFFETTKDVHRILQNLTMVSGQPIRPGETLLILDEIQECNKEFKGALSENYALQALTNQVEAAPRYWTSENPRYEVNFIIQHENEIIPVEVKSEGNIESRSMKQYKARFQDRLALRLRLSMQNLKLDGDLLNIPLFMADQADRLIRLALERTGSFGG